MTAQTFAAEVGGRLRRLVARAEEPIRTADEVARRLGEVAGEGWMQWTDGVWLRPPGGEWSQLQGDGIANGEAPSVDGARWPLDAELWDPSTKTATQIRHVDGRWIWTTLRFTDHDSEPAEEVIVVRQELIGNWRTKTRVDSLLHYDCCWRVSGEPGVDGEASAIDVWRPWLSVFAGFGERAHERKEGSR